MADAVTTRIIADNAVTSSKIQDGAVLSQHLASNDISGEHILDFTVCVPCYVFAFFVHPRKFIFESNGVFMKKGDVCVLPFV